MWTSDISLVATLLGPQSLTGVCVVTFPSLWVRNPFGLVLAPFGAACTLVRLSATLDGLWPRAYRRDWIHNECRLGHSVFCKLCVSPLGGCWGVAQLDWGRPDWKGWILWSAGRASRVVSKLDTEYLLYWFGQVAMVYIGSWGRRWSLPAPLFLKESPKDICPFRTYSSLSK